MTHPPPTQPAMPFSGLVLALGITALLIGTLISTLSPNGRTPGLVITGIGAVLTVPSYLLLRRAWYRTVYRVTNRWSPRLLLAAVGVTAAIVAGAFLITIVLDEVLGVRVPAALLFVPGGLLVMRYYMEMRTALQINALGVKLGGVPTPWASVDRLVLSGDAAAVTAEVRRRADAPAQDPGPVPVTIPAHRMPPADLVTAVRRFGPADVQVIRRQGTTEQRLSP